MIVKGLIAHFVGDYILQSHWMAVEKVHRWVPAVVHGVCYTLPFLFLTRDVLALAVIGGTHIVLDRYRVAKYVVWLKNQIGPASHRPSWAEARDNAGFSAATPAGLAMALMIVVDNTIHVLINTAALTLL